jgi:hypothetical protein
MEEHHKNNMNRRDFLKIVGITTATSTAALYGCGSKEGSSEGSKVLGPIPTDKMTYRSFPGLGSDKVSILGYGCMRWPTVPITFPPWYFYILTLLYFNAINK